MSSGSIAATVSSGYTGNSTEETEPEYTYQTTGNYDSRQQYSNQQSLFWQGQSNKYDSVQTVQLPSFMQPSPTRQAAPMKSSYPPTQTPHLLNQAPFMSQPSNQQQQFNTQVDVGLGIQYPIQRNNSEPLISAQSRFVVNPEQNLVKKKLFPINVNAPSYTPMTGNLEEMGEPAAAPKAARISPVVSLKSPTNVYDNQRRMSQVLKSPDAPDDAVEILKLDLAFKDQVNKSLSEKLKLLKVDLPPTKDESPGNSLISMPKNYYQLFKDLTHTLNERTAELDETKSRLEAIVVGLVMTKESSISTNGTFDAHELAHRITNKLSVLQSENEALLRMVSYSNKQSLLIELGLLRSENKAMRSKLKELGSEV